MVSAPAHGLPNLAPVEQLYAPWLRVGGLTAVTASRDTRPLVATVERGGRDLIDRLAPEWRALCDEAASEPFLHPDWLRTYLVTCAPVARLVVVTARAGGELRAVLPLVEERVRVAGVPLRRWRSIGAPSWPERFDLVAHPDDHAAAAAAVWDGLRATRGWDLVELAAVPPGGAALALRDRAAADGARVAARVAITTPHIPLASPDGRPTIEAALSGATTKFKANLRRRMRNLEQIGSVHLAWTDQYDEALVDQFLAMEAAGWKGRSGTAITSRPDTDAFFREMTKVAAANGWLSTYALLCAGRPVAIHLGLAWPRPGGDGTEMVYGVPKLAYDETLATYAPGHLLVGEILADLVARGLNEFDFLADDAPWKREWTDHLRRCERLFIFHPSLRPHLAHTLRFRLFPAARRRRLSLTRRARALRAALSAGRGGALRPRGQRPETGDLSISTRRSA